MTVFFSVSDHFLSAVGSESKNPDPAKKKPDSIDEAGKNWKAFVEYAEIAVYRTLE